MNRNKITISIFTILILSAFSVSAYDIYTCGDYSNIEDSQFIIHLDQLIFNQTSYACIFFTDKSDFSITCQNPPTYLEKYNDYVFDMNTLQTEQYLTFIKVGALNTNISNVSIRNCNTYGQGDGTSGMSQIDLESRENLSVSNILIEHCNSYNHNTGIRIVPEGIFTNITIQKSKMSNGVQAIIFFPYIILDNVSLSDIEIYDYGRNSSGSAAIYMNIGLRTGILKNLFMENIKFYNFSGYNAVYFLSTNPNETKGIGNITIKNLNIEGLNGQIGVYLRANNNDPSPNYFNLDNLTITNTRMPVSLQNGNIHLTNSHLESNGSKDMTNTNINLGNNKFVQNIILDNLTIRKGLFSLAGGNFSTSHNVCIKNTDNNADIDTEEKYNLYRTFNRSYFAISQYLSIDKDCTQNNIGWFTAVNTTTTKYNITAVVESRNLTALYLGANGGMNYDFTPNKSLTFFTNVAEQECIENWQDVTVACDGIMPSTTKTYTDINTCGTVYTLPEDYGMQITCCAEKWSFQLLPPTCTTGYQIINYVDLNQCNTSYTLPEDNGTSLTCCTENWIQILTPSKCINGTQLITYEDRNKCGTTYYLPQNNGTYVSCDYCIENWDRYLYPKKCTSGFQQVLYTDLNNCGTTYTLPLDNGTAVQCCIENWTKTLTPSTCLNGTQLITYTDLNNCGTSNYLPLDNGTYQTCCLENWTKTLQPQICLTGTQTIVYVDVNNCGTTLYLPKDNGKTQRCCVENWQPYLSPAICINGSQQLLYSDLNSCGTTYTLPADNGTYSECCVENWVQYLEPSICTTGKQKILYTDTNSCGTTYALPANNGTTISCKRVK